MQGPPVIGIRGPGNGPWTPAESIEHMDRHGIATAISSVTVPAEPFYDGTEKSRSIARGVNEYGAKMAVDYPGRFGLFAALPMPDIDGSLKEIEYSFDTLKADGICIFSSTPGKWPGDPFFHPTWEELNRRKAVVFIHPTTPNCCRNLAPGLPDYMLEFDFDTTRAVASLLVNGVLTKYPEIRWIVNHSGACVPVLAGRIQDRVVRNNPDLYPTGALEKLKKLYFEVAHATFPWPMAAMMTFAPMSHILFGTDFPLEPMETTIEQIPGLGLSSQFIRAMERENAERLFPRFKRP